MLKCILTSEKDANLGSHFSSTVLLTTGPCQLFPHWLGETRMWKMFQMLAKRFGRELNSIDDHKFRNISSDVAQIGRVPPKPMQAFMVWQF